MKASVDNSSQQGNFGGTANSSKKRVDIHISIQGAGITNHTRNALKENDMRCS